MSKASTSRSFSTMNVTNILSQTFVEEYTDPQSPLEKVTVEIEAGETQSFAGLVGEIIAGDIATCYCAEKGLPHFGQSFTEAVAKVKGEDKKATKKIGTPVKKAEAPVDDEDEGEDDGEDEGSEGTEGTDGQDEGSDSDAPAVTTGKAKTKR